MGRRCNPSCAVRRQGEKHAAGCGLLVASVLHNFTARLPQVPELTRHQIPKNSALWEVVLIFYFKVFKKLFNSDQDVLCVRFKPSQKKINVNLVGVSLPFFPHNSGNNYSADSRIHSLNIYRGNIYTNQADGLTVASQPWPPKPLLLDTK